MVWSIVSLSWLPILFCLNSVRFVCRITLVFTVMSNEQIEKEEEVVEGVVYQYNPPMQEDVDPEQAEIARNLLMVESDSSSQVRVRTTPPLFSRVDHSGLIRALPRLLHHDAYGQLFSVLYPNPGYLQATFTLGLGGPYQTQSFAPPACCGYQSIRSSK